MPLPRESVMVNFTFSPGTRHWDTRPPTPPDPDVMDVPLANASCQAVSAGRKSGRMMTSNKGHSPLSSTKSKLGSAPSGPAVKGSGRQSPWALLVTARLTGKDAEGAVQSTRTAGGEPTVATRPDAASVHRPPSSRRRRLGDPLRSPTMTSRNARRKIRRVTSLGDDPGYFSNIVAATPATMGHAPLVPVRNAVVPSSARDMMDTPGEKMSTQLP